jgi:hypothetical protein
MSNTASATSNYDYHIARLLVLLRHFAPHDKKPLRGLTKLAKLDFLLRYPSFTDILLATRNVPWPLGAEPTDSERNAVENRMIRYKYGPWDDRYYLLLGALVGMRLAQVSTKGKTAIIQLTEEGTSRAIEIAQSEEWSVLDSRAAVLRKEFDITGNKLRNIIYSELPEAVDRPYRVEI